MTRVIASIQFNDTEQGGRTTPISLSLYRTTVYFENVPELRAHAYDCRLAQLAEGEGAWVAPGESLAEVSVRFLSSDEVLPHMKPGVRFSLWEGKTIGFGTVVRIEDAA